MTDLCPFRADTLLRRLENVLCKRLLAGVLVHIGPCTKVQIEEIGLEVWHHEFERVRHAVFPVVAKRRKAIEFFLREDDLHSGS